MNYILNGIYVKGNDLWGIAQTYKSINFFPIKLKDVECLDLFYKLFHYPKNSIPDKAIIKSSYLKYILYIVQYSLNPGGDQIYQDLIKFLKYVTKNDNVVIGYIQSEVGDNFLEKITPYIKINNIDFNENDFDIIRAIILEQNGLGIDYIEQYNPELEEYLKTINLSYADLTLEDEIFIFCSLMRKTLNEIQDYTLYQFRRHFERILSLANYELYSPLEISGQISSKSGEKLIKDYFYHSKDDANRYESILIDKDKFIKKNPNLFDPNFVSPK